MKTKSKSKRKKEKEAEGWWTSWFTSLATSAPMTGGGRLEDKIEDRVARGWGRPMINGGGVDDWTV